MTVAVDFDGTLVHPIPFPQTNYTMLDNAEEVINRLAKQGVEFVLYTARYGWWRLPAIHYIKKNKLPIKTLLFNKKPRAKLYIDNHNIFCDNIDWLKIEVEILQQLEKEKNK